MGKYRDDQDLEFLQFCDNDDLSILVKFLTQDKDGNPRLTEGLTLEEAYKTSEGNYKSIWKLIAAELQKYGGDSIVNVFRKGKGINYKEILVDVCKKLKVNFNKNSEVIKIENNLMLKIIEDSIEKMSEEEKREFAKQMNINIANMTSVAILAAIQAAVNLGGFASYKIALIVANSTAKFLAGRGLTLALNAGLMRGLSIFAGPVGLIISGLLTLPMITGTAYRVTIPCVIQIAYMRQKLTNKNLFE